MKKLLLLFLILSPFLALSQNTVKIVHQNYTTVFDTVKHYPVVVDWWDTKARIGCSDKLPRVNAFAPDPQLPRQTNIVKDYIGSGYDKGHMCECEVNLCQGLQIEKECFYMDNMAPQWHSLNAGSWKKLEANTRKIALECDSVHVWAGSLGEAKKIGRVSVPLFCWKVIYVKSLKQWKAYQFSNTKDDSGNLNPETTVEAIELQTGLKFEP